MTVDELENKRMELYKQIKELQKQQHAIEQQIAKSLCPFKVGDRIVNDHEQEAEITGVRYCGWRDCKYILFGSRIKKNGERYKQAGELWTFTNPKLKQEPAS